MYETLLVLTVNSTQNAVCNCVVPRNKADLSHNIGLVFSYSTIYLLKIFVLCFQAPCRVVAFDVMCK